MAGPLGSHSLTPTGSGSRGALLRRPQGLLWGHSLGPRHYQMRERVWSGPRSWGGGCSRGLGAGPHVHSGAPESLPCPRPAVSLSWFTTPSAAKEKEAQSRGLSPPPRGLLIAGGAPARTLGLRICQSFYDQVTSSQARSATRRLEAQRLQREGPAPGTSSPRVTSRLYNCASSGRVVVPAVQPSDTGLPGGRGWHGHAGHSPRVSRLS